MSHSLDSLKCQGFLIQIHIAVTIKNKKGKDLWMIVIIIIIIYIYLSFIAISSTENDLASHYRVYNYWYSINYMTVVKPA